MGLMIGTKRRKIPVGNQRQGLKKTPKTETEAVCLHEKSFNVLLTLSLGKLEPEGADVEAVSLTDYETKLDAERNRLTILKCPAAVG